MIDVSERLRLVNSLTKPFSDQDLIRITENPNRHCDAETVANLATVLLLARIVIKALRENTDEKLKDKINES